MEQNKTILFTDPASLGVDGYYSRTGDVDDLACIIYMSQKLGGNLTVVISDDETGQRYLSFISLIGNKLLNNYDITVIKENDFFIVPEEKTNIHIHAPILETTAQILIDNIHNIEHVYTQGGNSAVNFNKSEKAQEFITIFAENYPFIVKGNVLTRYDTNGTNFTLDKEPEFQEKLTDDAVNKIYNQYFEFKQRAAFGTALGVSTPLCNRLYSSTGGDNGRPGNGILKYKELIQTLRDEGEILEINGKLLEAFNNTVSHGACDESAIQNGKDLIALMNLYCDYESLIVDDKLPNMGNLGEVVKREGVDERVSRKFDIIPGFTSTPLFDFAAAYYAISGDAAVEKKVLIEAAKQSLIELNNIKEKIKKPQIKDKYYIRENI
jgi:hypothetical protein